MISLCLGVGCWKETGRHETTPIPLPIAVSGLYSFALYEFILSAKVGYSKIKRKAAEKPYAS